MTDTEIQRPSMAEYFIRCMTQKYCCFAGRASRKEFWSFILYSFFFQILINIIISLYTSASISTEPENAAQCHKVFENVSSFVALPFFLPCLGVSIRRLHDIGKSGWWWLFGFLCCIGQIVLLIYYCRSSDPDINVYGEPE